MKRNLTMLFSYCKHRSLLRSYSIPEVSQGEHVKPKIPVKSTPESMNHLDNHVEQSYNMIQRHAGDGVMICFVFVSSALLLKCASRILSHISPRVISTCSPLKALRIWMDPPYREARRARSNTIAANAARFHICQLRETL